MKLHSASFSDGAPIPAECAFCAIDPKTHVTLSKNLNPQLSWLDVPSRGDDVNKEGRLVPTSLARIDFFHWVIVDLPASMVGVQEGEYSSSVVSRGKPGPAAPHGARHGINDYTGWFADDKDMAGDYYGYDGPCPPWNDEIPHRYTFTVFAPDVARLPLEGRFDGHAARKAIAGHVLAQASITGRYTLNPSVKV